MSGAHVDERLADVFDFFENAPIGFYLADADGMIRLANRAERAATGFADAPDRYIGRHVSELYADPSVGERLGEAWMEGRSVLNLRTELRLRDGSTRAVVLHAGPSDEGGSVGMCLTFFEPPAGEPPQASASVSEQLASISTAERVSLQKLLDDAFEN